MSSSAILESCLEGDLSSNITERSGRMSDDFITRRAFSQIVDAVRLIDRTFLCFRQNLPKDKTVDRSGEELVKGTVPVQLPQGSSACPKLGMIF
jgi:hypothetical protein